MGGVLKGNKEPIILFILMTVNDFLTAFTLPHIALTQFKIRH